MKALVTLLVLLMISIISGGCLSTPPPLVVPKHPGFRLAEQSFLEGNHLTAIKHYQRFLKAQPYTPYQADIYYRLGLCYLAEGEYDQALEALFQARIKTTNSPLKGQIMAATAQTYMYQKDYPKAARYYKQALVIARQDLKSDEILFYLGIALMRLSADETDSDKWQEGAEYLKELVKTMPKSSFTGPAWERLSLPTQNFVVQLGKYRHKDNALKELRRFRYDKDINGTLKSLRIQGEEFHFIWVGNFSDWRSAKKKADEFQDKGVEAIVLP